MYLVDDVLAVVDYMTTDQEAEGRDLAIKKASQIYSSILSELEKKAENQKKFESKTNNFNDQAKKIRDIAVYYVDETDKLNKLIEVMKKRNTKPNSIDVSSVDSLDCLGCICHNNFGLDLSGWINGKMDKKRREFFDKEFAKQCKVWEAKINSVQEEIKQVTLSLNELEDDDKLALMKLKDLLLKAIKEYEKVSAQYHLLLCMEKNI